MEKSVSAKRFYRPELDILRFFAFFMVFVHHSVPTKWRLLHELSDIGALGMCLFFVLSSFLITELLRLEKQRAGTIRMHAFYLRRILRIWPLYFVVLGFSILWGLKISSLRLPPNGIVAMILLAGNWYVVWHGYLAGFVGPLWSISLEEQFYIIWPTVCHLFDKTLLIAFSLCLLPLGAGTILYLAYAGASRNDSIWVNSFVQFQMFGLGALLAILLNGRIPVFPRLLRLLLLVGALLCFVAAQAGCHVRGLIPVSPGLLVLGYLNAGFGSCLLIVCLLGMRVPKHFAPVIYLGKISYGLYVFHKFFIDEVNNIVGSARNLPMIGLKFTVALGCTIVMAALSYRFLESPFIRLKERFAVVQSRGV